MRKAALNQGGFELLFKKLELLNEAVLIVPVVKMELDQVAVLLHLIGATSWEWIMSPQRSQNLVPSMLISPPFMSGLLIRTQFRGRSFSLLIQLSMQNYLMRTSKRNLLRIDSESFSSAISSRAIQFVMNIPTC
jgi:hypothetical protein